MAGTPRLTRPAWTEAIGAAGLAAAFALFQAWWWTRHRSGTPWFIDEAGYLDFAIDHARAIDSGSVGRVLESADLQAPAAPLVSLLTGAAIAGTDRPVGAAVATMAIAAAALVGTTWLLARWFLPAVPALVLAGTVGALPAVLTLSGTYYFATASAAGFTAGLGCLLRSEWGARWPWAVAAGAAFGLALLSRTMIVGFLPPVVAVSAAGALVAWRSDRSMALGRRLGALAASAAAGVAVAAPWYLPNLEAVLDYLRTTPPPRGPGGRRTGSGGGAVQVTGIRDLRLLISDLLVPMALVVAVAAGIALAGWMRGRRARVAPAGTAAAVRREGSLPLAAIIGLCCAVLVASGQAVGQWLPLLPALLVLVVVGLHRSAPRAAPVVLAAFAVLSVVHLAQATRAIEPLDGVRTVGAGPLGRLPVLDNRTLLESQLARDLRNGHLTAEFDSVPGLLASLVGEVSQRAAAIDEPPVLLVVGGHDSLVNINSLKLADQLAHGRSRVVVGGLPIEGPRPVEEWAAMLADPARGQPNAVVVFDRSDPDEPSNLGDRSLADALAAIGFDATTAGRLPDGRDVVLWWRPRAEMTVPAAPAGPPANP